MLQIRIRRGLDLPVPGAPVQSIEPARRPRSVALLGDDHPGVHLVPKVEVGDRVRAGQALAVARRNPDLRFVSPVAGRVAALHRGEARRIVALEVEVEGSDALELPRIAHGELFSLSRERTAERLIEAGDWVALRTRPFGRIPTPGSVPAAIFVRAMDSQPLAADAAVVLRERREDLEAGLVALSRLTDGPVYLCSRPGAIEGPLEVERLQRVEVRGPHPAGLVGTHVHHLLPVSTARRIWYVGHQDVVAIGRGFREGRPDPTRVVSLAGPAVRQPRLLRSVLGASSEDLVRGELGDEPCRVVSGSLLSGRIAARPGAFLGRYHEQLCAIPARAPESASESGGIRAWGWLRRATHRRDPRSWSAERHGEPRAFYPLDLFERVFPLRLPLAPLLRALAAGDMTAAASFGALELEEEDLALCSYLCPAKLAYGPLLRTALDRLEETLP
jgi:Na+-transporting NADH:ubiquinone oxidoreductase subunit A